MRPITGEVLIGAPTATEFDFVADQCNEPLYNANMLRAERLTPGAEIEGTLTFTPKGNGTRLRWVWRLHPHGFLHLLAPIAQAVGSRQERANWTALKSYLEASPTR